MNAFQAGVSGFILRTGPNNVIFLRLIFKLQGYFLILLRNSPFDIAFGQNVKMNPPSSLDFEICIDLLFFVASESQQFRVLQENR